MTLAVPGGPWCLKVNWVLHDVTQSRWWYTGLGTCSSTKRHLSGQVTPTLSISLSPIHRW